MIKISPSILAADFANLGDAVICLEKNGADYIHCDVMDGVFVPQITFGAKMVASLKAHTNLVLDVHLMIENPIKHIDDFADAGADIITFHAEAARDIDACISAILAHDIKVGISLKPETPIDVIEHVLHKIDMVLVMTVEPGYGGQVFIDAMLKKVRMLRDMRPTLDIQVDGGINETTVKSAIHAGANIIVAESYVFSGDMKARIESLRG